MSFKILFALFVLLVLTSIGWKKNDKDLLVGNWKVTHIVYEGANVYPSPAIRDITINFTDKDYSTLKLEVNDCIFDYELSSKNSMKINIESYTLICCDSDFSDKVDHLFRETTKYEFKSEKSLMLIGKGQIFLERLNDDNN